MTSSACRGLSTKETKSFHQDQNHHLLILDQNDVVIVERPIVELMCVEKFRGTSVNDTR